MTLEPKCAYCQNEFMNNDRVIFSHRETFIFKPAHIPDIEISTPGPSGREILRPAAAILSPEALAKSREDYKRTAVVNTFCDWGKATIPNDAFNFRHQWCEPVKTGSGGGAHAVTKHSIRFGRAAAGRLHG
jgi:hypothetical protein